MPQRNTENIIRKQAYSTSKAGGLDQASDMTEKEEVDLEALIELELELYRQEGFPVPSEITSPQWQELLTKGTVSARKKYLTFLFKNEMKRKNKRKLKDSIRKQKEEEERQKRENPVEEDRHIEYGLWKNSIFIKILETSMNHFYHTRVVQAMLHGQPLIVDLDFEEHMSSKERQNCAYQIQADNLALLQSLTAAPVADITPAYVATLITTTNDPLTSIVPKVIHKYDTLQVLITDSLKRKPAASPNLLLGHSEAAAAHS
ncbi:hypothetical protein O3P69_010676 [Scylla paramamosain]|uniref:Uncharacterized protein n=1 Tax=Scylla paramamosain TaxID=85552 RepID=A0AAW0TEH3_SCYPA